MRMLILILIVDSMMSALFAQDIEDLCLAEAQTNCIQEIKSGRYAKFKIIEVEECRLLAWYRIRDNRPWYADNALFWSKVKTDKGIRWALVHMARNPMEKVADKMRAWHSYFVYDARNEWLLYFDRPPTNRDVYDKMRYFIFEPMRDWVIYDSKILVAEWIVAIGEMPNKSFSNRPSLTRNVGN